MRHECTLRSCQTAGTEAAAPVFEPAAIRSLRALAINHQPVCSLSHRQRMARAGSGIAQLVPLAIARTPHPVPRGAHHKAPQRFLHPPATRAHLHTTKPHNLQLTVFALHSTASMSATTADPMSEKRKDYLSWDDYFMAVGGGKEMSCRSAAAACLHHAVHHALSSSSIASKSKVAFLSAMRSKDPRLPRAFVFVAG